MCRNLLSQVLKPICFFKSFSNSINANFLILHHKWITMNLLFISIDLTIQLSNFLLIKTFALKISATNIPYFERIIHPFSKQDRDPFRKSKKFISCLSFVNNISVQAWRLTFKCTSLSSIKFYLVLIRYNIILFQSIHITSRRDITATSLDASIKSHEREEIKT